MYVFWFVVRLAFRTISVDIPGAPWASPVLIFPCSFCKIEEIIILSKLITTRSKVEHSWYTVPFGYFGNVVLIKHGIPYTRTGWFNQSEYSILHRHGVCGNPAFAVTKIWVQHHALYIKRSRSWKIDNTAV